MASPSKITARLLALFATAAIACGGAEDDRDQVAQYATDPIACTQDSDCCVVNDDCRTTAYLVASKDSAAVSSLIASADKSMCQRCVTPLMQASCVAGTCVGERIDLSCRDQLTYPGNHCGKIDVPEACLPSARSAAEVPSPPAAVSKPLGIFSCGVE
jgi:hypothetical protein